MRVPSEECTELQYEIADDYLPDRMINGMDCPDIGLAKEIIDRVLDAAIEAMNKEALRLNCFINLCGATDMYQMDAFFEMLDAERLSRNSTEV